MDFELTNEQTAVQSMAREWALAEVAPVIQRYDEAHEFPRELLASLAKTGLLGALVPEEYGGAALDYVSYALAVEELNRVDASVGITMWAHNSLCTNHLVLFGTPAQKAAYLPRLARGESLGAWGLTEPGSGSDAAAMKSRAVCEGDGYVLNGSKAFITNAGVSEVAVVMAVTDPGRGAKGISAFVLDKGMTGFSAGRPYRKLGLHASNTAELIFDNVSVPADHLVGEPGMGFVNTMQVLEGGRVAIADMGTEVEAARLLTLRAAALKDAGKPAKTAASMAKVFASEVAMKAATKSLQIHGGAGYITEFPIERIFRDAKLTEIGEGTSEIQRMVIAQDLLGFR